MLRAGRPAGAEIARRDHDVTLPSSRAALALLAAALPGYARAMHIADGVLPASHPIFWAVSCAPVVTVHVAGAAVYEAVSRGARAWLEEQAR